MKHTHSANCKELLTTLNAYIDGDLDDAHCHHVEAHLTDCQNCTVVVNTLRKTIQLYKMDGEEITMPITARQRLFACLGLDDPAKNHE